MPPAYVDTTGLVTTSVNPLGVIETINIPPGTALGISTPQNRVVDVIQVSDIDSEKGVEVGYTSTENVRTKLHEDEGDVADGPCPGQSLSTMAISTNRRCSWDGRT